MKDKKSVFRVILTDETVKNIVADSFSVHGVNLVLLRGDVDVAIFGCNHWISCVRKSVES